MWRGRLGLHSRFRLFRLPAPSYQTMPRFHIPLIEPYVRYERIRLSDKAFTRSLSERSAAHTRAGTTPAPDSDIYPGIVDYLDPGSGAFRKAVDEAGSSRGH